MPQDQLLKLVHEELHRIRDKNPRYSVRAFSKKLGLPVSTLWGVLNNKLPLTKGIAEKILANLAVDPKTSARLMRDLKYRDNSRGKSANLKVGGYSQLEMDQFHFICEWYYLAVLSLASTESFEDDPLWISKTLGIQMREAKNALARLERLGLLEREKDGKLFASGKQFKTTNGIPNAHIRKHHLEGLDLARRAMDEDGFSVCDFSSLTMEIDPDRLPEAKKLITEFSRGLNTHFESGRKREVYRMGIQLFPLSNREKGSKSKIQDEVAHD